MSSYPVYDGDIPIGAWVLWQEDDDADAGKGKFAPRDDENTDVDEEALNRFIRGAKIERAKMFSTSVQIWLENGAFVEVWIGYDGIKVDLRELEGG